MRSVRKSDCRRSVPMLRLALTPLLILVFTVRVPSNVLAPAYVPSIAQPRIDLACGCLETLCNLALQLFKDTPASNAYYTTSDNLLAAKALQFCATSTSLSVSAHRKISNGFPLKSAGLALTTLICLQDETMQTVEFHDRGNSCRPSSQGAKPDHK